MRIASLLPSATEIVCALGAGHELVGRSHECDFPAGVEDVPVLSSVHPEIFGGFGEKHRASVLRVAHDLTTVAFST